MLLLSVLSKESGALFLPLLLLVEVLLIGQDSTLRNSVFLGRLTFRKTAIFGLVSLALLYCAWAVHLYLNPDVYLSRPFTFGERLLTEVRVLVFYLGQTIAPRLTALSLYHDDFILRKPAVTLNDCAVPNTLAGDIDRLYLSAQSFSRAALCLGVVPCFPRPRVDVRST